MSPQHMKHVRNSLRNFVSYALAFKCCFSSFPEQADSRMNTAGLAGWDFFLNSSPLAVPPTPLEVSLSSNSFCILAVSNISSSLLLLLRSIIFSHWGWKTCLLLCFLIIISNSSPFTFIQFLNDIGPFLSLCATWICFFPCLKSFYAANQDDT